MSIFDENEIKKGDNLDYGYDDEEKPGEITKSEEDIARSDIEVDDTFEENNVDTGEDAAHKKGASSDSYGASNIQLL